MGREAQAHSAPAPQTDYAAGLAYETTARMSCLQQCLAFNTDLGMYQ